jgi:peroxiredoxin
MGMAKQSLRFQELEEKFNELESQLADTPEKQALSVLHAMIQEARRAQVTATTGNNGAKRTLDDIANLYKSAPPMEGPAENQPLPIGTHAPDFTLPDASNRPISLSDFRGKNVVVAFYPLDWSPACSDQLSLYQGELDEFDKYNAQVLGISVDSIYSHGAWAAVRGIQFPLLADFHPKGDIARRYSVYRESSGFSERALYVVDSAGIIRYAHVSPQLHHVPDIYELLENLRAIQKERERVPA